MIQYQIIDLDGCISDDRWRRARIGPPGAPDRFREYHSLCANDPPENLHELRREVGTIIITGRPMLYRDATLYWLERNARRYPRHLFMRPRAAEGVPSLEFKRGVLEDLFSPTLYRLRPEQITDALDDRADIVEMYRAAGLPARVVRIGEMEHENG